MSDQTGLACRPNIGPRERRRRIVLAAIATAIAIATAAAFLAWPAPRPWRLAIFLPTWAAVVCYLEARNRTCVVLAARGLRNLDTGNQPVADAAERQASAAQSRTIYVRSTLVATIVAVALLVAPL